MDGACTLGGNAYRFLVGRFEIQIGDAYHVSPFRHHEGTQWKQKYKSTYLQPRL